MPSLPSRIHPHLPPPPPSSTSSHPSTPTISPEDVFSTGLTTLFPDANITSHGFPGGVLIYTSPTYGDIHLAIPEHPEQEEGRKLFAHYLWNAGAVVADFVERASQEEEGDGEEAAQEGKGKEWGWGWGWWDVKDRKVLELGAGSALPSLIAALSGAKEIYVSDHPSSPALVAGSIRENVRKNLLRPVKSIPNVTETDISGEPSFSRCKTKITILPHIWGALSSPSARYHAHTFDRLFVADCLWMPSQHVNLVRTIRHFLKPLNYAVHTANSTCGTRPCALVVADFHTGRAIVAAFFRIAATATTVSSTASELGEGGGGGEGEGGGGGGGGGLRIEEIYEYDVNDGSTREFGEERPGEGPDERRRWCVVAVLTLPKIECKEGGETDAQAADRGNDGWEVDHGVEAGKRGNGWVDEEGAEATLTIDETGWV